MNLLAAEITARTGRDPGEHYAELAREFAGSANAAWPSRPLTGRGCFA